MKKKRQGFTLIELLAVIVILGLLMAIAIPSVTKYITQSRKKTVTTSIGNYIGALTNQVNDMEYTFTGTNVIYAVPIECIALERGGRSPFGEWMQANDKYWAYVLVQYDDNTSSYTYGFTFKDSAGYGLYPTSIDKIQENGSQIQQDLDLKRPSNGNINNVATKDKWIGFVVDDNTDLHVLEASREGEVGDGVDSCTLCQKGKNYDEVEEEKNSLAQNGNKYIMLNDTNQYVLINDENAENGIELYNGDTLVGGIPNSLITRSDNKIVVSGTGEYDATYTIFDDGYIEMNGMPVAKSVAKWVTRNEDSFFIIHNEVIYSSSDGNNFGEVIVKFEDINFILNKYLVSNESPFEFDKFKGFSFANYNELNLTYENFYDFLHLLNYENRCASNLRVCDFYLQYETTGNYPFWGGSAYDKKKDGALITYADWDSSKITLEKSQTLYIIENNIRNKINFTSKIIGGTYVLSEEEKYFYKNVLQKDIIFIDDYPFAYEKGMTWKEWIHSSYDGSGLLDDIGGDTYIYIPKEYLDSSVESGHAMGVGSLVSALSLNNYGGELITFDYCYGDVKLPILKEEEYSKYGYNSSTHKFVGWQWDGGLVKDTLLSYEFFNYYIEEKNQPVKGFSSTAYAVFEEK